MMERVKRLVLRWYRIPPDPQPPAGSEASVRVFRAGRSYFRLALARWGIRQVGAILGIFFFLAFGPGLVEMARDHTALSAADFTELPEYVLSWGTRLGIIDVVRTAEGSDRLELSLEPIFLIVETFGIGFFLLQLPLTYAVVRLNYELRWYIVTDRSLRIREGVASIGETTMTFANIQNLSIRQGPVQRLFGIADLRVRTAGGGSDDTEAESGQPGGKGESMHIAYFRGVDNATEIRDLILAHVRSLRDSGLGEVDSVVIERPAAQPVDAARRLLEETRAVRARMVGLAEDR
jgi:hypothetical protein